MAEKLADVKEISDNTMSIFDRFRKHLADGKDMTDLQVVLEVARHDLVFVHGLIATDRPEVTPVPTFEINVSDTIELVDAAIEKLVPFSERM